MNLDVKQAVGTIVSNLLLLLMSSAVVAQPAIEPSAWQSTLHTEHQLLGKIWDIEGRRFVDSTELLAELSKSRYLLLGEKHDNPDHHALHLKIVGELISREQLNLVAFEMMDSGYTDRLEKIQQQQFSDSSALKDYLQWDDEGWDWDFYGPIIQALVTAGIPLAAGNLSADEVQQVYRQTELQSVTSVLDAAAVEQLHKEIDESHCQMLPQSQFPAMVRVQQARDQRMASSLSAAGEQVAGDKIKVLITGNYHIRKDVSVPNYLLSLDASLQAGQIVSLAFLEVDPASSDPIDYLQAYSEVSPYDFLWFTPAVSAEDYCASLQR